METNGQVWVGGYFHVSNGTNRHIARLNTNGTLDLSFNAGGPENEVRAVSAFSGGKVLIAGSFYSVNGTNRNFIARLQADGSIDNSFVPGPIVPGDGYGGLASLLQRDGKVLIGGSFRSINGYIREGVARLNDDGSLDLEFNPTPGTTISPGSGDGSVYCLAAQQDGKVLVGGLFGAVNGVSRTCIARLNPNGSLDTSFNPVLVGNGFPTVWAVASQSDGKTVIGGNFTSVNGTNISGIARLNGDTSSTPVYLLSPQVYFGMYLQGTISNTYRIEWTANTDAPSLWTPLFNVILQTNSQFILDPTPASGQRFYRAVTLP